MGRGSPADELRRAVLVGKPVRRGEGEPAAQGQAWGDDRTLRAEAVHEVVADSQVTTRPRAVVLVGLRITGRLNFEALELDAPLIAHGCYFDEPVNLIAAKVAEISLTACLLPAVVADRLETRGDLDLSASTLKVLGLLGAHIGGALVLNGATLTGGSYPSDLESGTLRPPGILTTTFDEVALVADQLRVDRNMDCDTGFSAGGVVRLPGAQIGGQLLLRGATLANDLYGDGLHIGQDMFCQSNFSAAGDVRLPGAQIGGQLVLRDATLAKGLNADGIHVEGMMSCDAGFSAAREVRLPAAQIGGPLVFTGAKLDEGLNAQALQVHDSMLCDGPFSASGEVRLAGAHIVGELVLAGATLAKDLYADGLEVDQSLGCEGFAAEGEVRLAAARIGGHLIFTGASLAKGLNADWLRVGRSMACDAGFSAKGELRVSGAQIGGQLVFTRATLTQGLLAARLELAQDMLCQAFSAGGEVRLPGAHIGGRLEFDGAALDGPESALDLEDARVDGALRLRFATRPLGRVDLTGARVGWLLDSERTWPSRLRLRGCVYRDAQAAEDASAKPMLPGAVAPLPHAKTRAASDVKRRLRWIRLAEDGPADRPRTPRLLRRMASTSTGGAGYSPQPYAQLMTVYRQEGRDGDARRVAYERERRRQTQLGLVGRAWNVFLRWTVGYGYRPLRALALLGILVLVGTLIFSSFHTAGDLKALKSEHPPFVACIYTIDRLIPVVSFGLRDAFGPSAAAQWWAFAYTLLGWALTVAVAAGLNAAVRRD